MGLSLPFLTLNMSQRLPCCKRISDSIVIILLLLQGCEIWAPKEHDKSEITAAEIKFSRKSTTYTMCDHKNNQCILGDLRTQPIFVKTSTNIAINEYRMLLIF
jgi:hypothetical protein